MNEENYNNLIKKTFCENAIRTVLLIDDQYSPYAKLVSDVKNAHNLEELKSLLDFSERAAGIQQFFEEKKLICDISDGFTNFDPEKARKSDLIILDYYLEGNEPRKTVEILNELLISNHMNLVILYTNKELDESWLQVICSLRGCGSVLLDDLLNEDELDFWLDKTDEGIPEAFLNTITNEDMANFLLNRKPSKETIKRIVDELNGQDRKYSRAIYLAICHHKVVQGKLDLLEKQDKYEGEVYGNITKSKWLKIGNLFLSFSHKDSDYDGEKLYNRLEESLIDWKPNFYRLILSEIENQLENEGVSVSSFTKENYLEQAGWFWQILSDTTSLNTSNLITQNNQLIKDKLLVNQGLLEFIDSLLECFSVDFPQQSIIEPKKDEQEVAAYQQYKKNVELDNNKTIKEQILYSIKTASEVLNASPSEVVIALNKSLSLKEFTTSYITTGSILRSEDKDLWYMCVSPACDCVPAQNNTNLTKRLSPKFKPLKFIELKKVKQSSALSKATDGKFLFLPNGIFLQIVGEPELEYVIASNVSSADKVYNVYFLNSVDDNVTATPTELIIYAQLKEDYSARFQAIASHHVGRIGVDFIKYLEEN